MSDDELNRLGPTLAQHCLISIYGLESERPKSCSEAAAFLGLCFADVDRDCSSGLKAARPEQIQSAFDFARQNIENPLIVTCKFGASRSPAIALLIDIAENGSVPDAFSRADPGCRPSMHVLYHGLHILGKWQEAQPFIRKLYSEE